MKVKLSLLFLFFCCYLTANSQINLIGCVPNHSTSHTDIVTWEAFDTSSVVHFPTIMQGYLLCSSVFDAWNSNYYITGTAAGIQGLLGFNSQSTNQTFTNFSHISNISEIDMSTGKIYTLTSDSSEYFSVNQFDIQSGTDSVIGVVHQPGMMGIVVDAISFDSNNGIIYYIGRDNSGTNCLFSIYVRNPVFSYTITNLQTGPLETSFQCLNYDNSNNLLFGLQREYNPSGNVSPSKIVEINTTTGFTTTHGVLNGITGHQVGSSAFDQQTGTFILIGVDSSFSYRLIMFNTVTNTIQYGYLPQGVSELVCDNHSYAQAAYGTNSIAGLSEQRYSIFPNPVAEYVSIIFPSGHEDCEVFISGMSGKVIKNQPVTNNCNRLNISELNPGFYILEIKDNQGITTLKLVKK